MIIFLYNIYVEKTSTFIPAYRSVMKNPEILRILFQNLLANTPQNLLSTGVTPMSGRGLEAPLSGGQAPVYAPVASPAPPSPSMAVPTPQANDIIPQLQVDVSTVQFSCRFLSIGTYIRG